MFSDFMVIEGLSMAFFLFLFPFRFHDVLGNVFRLGSPPQYVLEVDVLRMRALG